MDISQLKGVEVIYHTATLPPPFQHEIQFHVRKKDHGATVQFQLQYLDREEMTEEELYGEGFTPDDDFTWHGGLADVWVEELWDTVSKTTFPQNQDEARAQSPLIILRLHGHDGTNQEGTPAETTMWEYLVQEMMQAFFEMAGRERPLEVSFLEVAKQEPPQRWDAKAYFATREAEVVTQTGDDAPQPHTLEWPRIKELLKVLYRYEYDFTQVKGKYPGKRGQYLNLGEGWLAIPKALLPMEKDKEPSAEPIREAFAALLG